MLDSHVHIEHQPYSLELIDNMVKVAQFKGVDEINLLDHTHKFKEFVFLYEPTKKDPPSYKWYKDHKTISIQEYLDFISLVKSNEYPVKFNFGLEVCYFEETEDELREELKKYDFDFLIGSVHFIDGFAYDINKESWNERDVDYLYKRYFEINESLVKSKLFTQVGHPDAIKKFGYTPSFDLHPYYESLANVMKEHNIMTENNTGFARFGLTNYGLNKDFYDILKKAGVKVNKSSDAHKFQDIGNKFDEIESCN